MEREGGAPDTYFKSHGTLVSKVISKVVITQSLLGPLITSKLALLPKSLEP